MTRDYSNVPCDVKLTNNTDDNIIVRIGYCIDDIIVKQGGEEIVHIDNSDIYARLYNEALNLNLVFEEVTPGPVPPPVPPEPVITYQLEKGKKYTFKFKDYIPELEDEATYNAFVSEFDQVSAAQDEGNSWGVWDGQLCLFAVNTGIEDWVYEPAFVDGGTGIGGWTIRGEKKQRRIEEVTFSNIKLVISTGEVDVLNCKKFEYIFDSITEIPEN